MTIEIQLTEYQKIVVSETEFEGKNYVDVRRFYRTKNGPEWRPTQKGISIPKDPVVLKQVRRAIKQCEVVC